MRLSILRKRQEAEPGDPGSEPVIAQGHVVGRIQPQEIGVGRQGRIRLHFFQPQRTEQLLVLDETTGQSGFVSAQKGEIAARGTHARDHGQLTIGQADRTIYKADVFGGQVRNVKSRREYWPIEQGEPSEELSLRQLALGGFKTNLGERPKRRLAAWERLKKIREDAKKRRRQTQDDGVPF